MILFDIRGLLYSTETPASNSNSAAQAIVRASTCIIIPPPDGERISPGNSDADEINFVIPLDCLDSE